MSGEFGKVAESGMSELLCSATPNSISPLLIYTGHGPQFFVQS